VVVTAVPYLLGHAYRLRDLLDYDEDLEPEAERDAERAEEVARWAHAETTPS
jgi:hypothetical protein